MFCCMRCFECVFIGRLTRKTPKLTGVDDFQCIYLIRKLIVTISNVFLKTLNPYRPLLTVPAGGGTLRSEKLFPIQLGLLLERQRLDRRVGHVERIHQIFDVRFIHLVEEVLDAFIVPVVVHHHEPQMAGRHKPGHEPLVKLVDRFQVRVVRFPFVLVDQIECGVRNELVQMTMVFFLPWVEKGGCRKV